jgi:hypothetical protein
MAMNAPRHFTQAEAQKTLPLVRQIVADILAVGGRIRALKSHGDHAHRHEELRKESARLEALLDELRQIGCQYKDWDFKMGLVDFPAVIDGKEVLLCWRSDEPEIKWYHGYMDGYAGRKPIPAASLD